MSLLDGADQSADLRKELETKWKTKFPAAPPELIDAKVESDLYIKTLEARADDIRESYLKAQEELQSRASLEDLKKQLQELQTQPHQPDVKPEAQKFDTKEIRSLITTEIAQNKQQERQDANYNLVLTKLKEKYGTNYQTPLKEQIAELGLTPETLNERARTEPQLLIRALGLDAAPPQNFFSAPPRSGQRNDNFAPKAAPVRDWNYYQELKKGNPKAYLDKQIAVQMHNDVIEQGEAKFYGQN